MRRSIVIAVVVACGPKPQPPPPPPDTRTPIEKRRDAACEAIAQRGTKCALDDAKRDLAAGKVSQQQFDKDTAPDIQRALLADNRKRFCVPLSSFQVRVLEVCNRATTTCDELYDCIQHINDKPPK